MPSPLRSSSSWFLSVAKTVSLFVKTACLLAVLLQLSACQSTVRGVESEPKLFAPASSSSSFVQVNGVQFMRNGRPFYYVGSCYVLPHAPQASLQLRLKSDLDLLQSAGVNHLRIHVTAHPVFLADLDLLLSEMARRDMVAALFLMKENDNLEVYKALLNRVVSRVNSVTGVAYAYDPTIMSWQLDGGSTESTDAGLSALNLDAHKHWLEESANHLRTMDHRHLVSVAGDAFAERIDDVDAYRAIFQSEVWDYLTLQLRPSSWGWFDDASPESTLPFARTQSKAYLLRYVDAAVMLGRPLVVDAFGLDVAKGEVSATVGRSYRDAYFSGLYEFVLQQAELGKPLAGTNFWIGTDRFERESLYGEVDGQKASLDRSSGAPNLSDILNSDPSIMTIVAEHAQLMGAL